MVSSFDDSVNVSIKTHTRDLFASLQTGGTALTSFLNTLTTFQDTVHLHSHKLPLETLTSIQNLGIMIRSITSGVLQLEKSTEELVNSNTADVSKILGKKMAKLAINDEEDLKSVKSVPAYLESAYTWLLANLHNPYPTKQFKKNLARDTKSSLKDIDAWFTDVRKRIGWNQLRKTRFSNKQEKIIAASTQFFKANQVSFSDNLESNLISETNGYDMYRSDFMTMEKKARSLYSGKFTMSELTTSHFPNRDIQTTPGHIENSKEQFYPYGEGAIYAYPTPQSTPREHGDTSPPSPPTPLPAVADSETRKRSRSPTDNFEEDNLSSRQRKRIRVGTPQFLDHFSDRISPFPVGNNDVLAKSPMPNTTGSNEVSDGLRLKRKRRLSDGDSIPLKRPHTAFSLPRLQTVSNPFPLSQSPPENLLGGLGLTSTALEHDLNDAIPSPANIEDLNSIEVPLDVDLYQYGFSTSNVIISPPEPLMIDVAPGAPLLESLPFADPLHDKTFGFIDLSDFQFDLLSEPSHNQVGPAAEHAISIFPTSDSLLFSESPTDDGYCRIDTGFLPTIYAENNIFTHHDSALSCASPKSAQHEAKRARVQALRNELALYEAEGL